MNKLIIMILLPYLLISSEFFSANGYGNNEKEAKNNALKNLSELFSVRVSSSNKVQKILSNNEFKVDIDTTLDVSSDIVLPNVEYEIITKKYNLFGIKAVVLEKDIISYMKKYKIFLESLNETDDDKLQKTLSDIENIYKLFLSVNIKESKTFIEFMKTKHKEITSLLYDAILIVPNYKTIELYINDKKTKGNNIFIESEKEHNIKASKKGYFPIEKNIYLRAKERKTINFEFIKNKKRYIHFESGFNLSNGFLKKYKIINDSNAKTLFKISYKIKELDKGKFIKIITDGYLIIKQKNKKVKMTYLYDKMCLRQRKEKCLRISKNKVAKNLIKQSLIRIDNNE